MWAFSLTQGMFREVVSRDLGSSQDIWREAQFLTDGFDNVRGRDRHEFKKFFTLLKAFAHLSLVRSHVL